MNPSPIRGVMRMYKERLAITARGEELVQEWILSATGTESDAVERSDQTRGASLAVAERE